MKKLITILFFSLMFSQTIIPQWHQQNSGTTETLRSVTFLDVNIGTLVGNDGIIKRTSDGGTTWSSQPSGTTEVLEDVCFTNIDAGTAVGWGGTIIRTTDGGTNWVSQSGGTGKKLNRVFFVDSDYGWIVGDNIILRTTNGGTLWTTLSDIGLFYGVVFIDTSIGWVVGENGVIYKTTDGGGTWTLQLSGVSEWLIAVSFIDENNATICGENGTILRTTNAGVNWSQQASNTTEILYGISFTDVNNGTAVGTNGIILRTNNGGFTPMVNLLYPNGGEHWITGTTEAIVWTCENVEDVKIELSLDNGANWSSIVDSTASNGLYVWTVNCPVYSNECLIRISDLSFPDYYDESDSVFTIALVPSVEFLTDKGIPEEFILFQNFPNPFNPATTIQFAVPTGCMVELKLYDVLGNEVSTLISEYKDTGYYSYKLNGHELPSGIYFYRLEAGFFAETKKMVLLR
jgi:photosystem II stability/assembly factor-like uncharacterized protein